MLLKVLSFQQYLFLVWSRAFPLMRIDDGPDQMEEERRLFYVAVTRAMNQLYLLNANIEEDLEQ